MDTPDKLKSTILKVNTTIHENLLTVGKYLCEMPIRMPDSDDTEINIENLKAYNNSLGILLNKYRINYKSQKK